MSKKIFAVLFSLCLLAGCAAPGTAETGFSSTEGESGGAETVLQGETVSAQNGFANMTLTLPEGWEAEAVNEPQDDGMDLCRIAFWPTEAPELRLTLEAYAEGLGLCGTGVTIEDVTFAGGLTATSYTEEISDSFWYLLIYDDTPGTYTVEFTGDRALMESYQDELDAILGSVVLGEGYPRQSEAEAAAAAEFGGEYAALRAAFNMADGMWTVTFYEGQYQDELAQVMVAQDGTAALMTEIAEEE